jgi:hypothetical protein
MEMKDHSLIMRMVFNAARKQIIKGFGDKADYSDPTFKLMLVAAADSPLRFGVISGGDAFPANVAEGLLELANGHFLTGLKKLSGK